MYYVYQVFPEAFPVLHAVPKLHQLQLLERHGKRVKVIDVVAAEWDRVALRLFFESYDISRIERDHPQQSVQACSYSFRLNGLRAKAASHHPGTP